MNKTCLFLSLIVLSPFSYALDLMQAVQRAQGSDPEWQAHQYQYEADQLNLGIAQGVLMPTVTLSGNITRKHQDIDDASLGGLGNGNGSADLMTETSTTRHLTVTARQPLFRWDAWQGYKQVKTSVQLSEVTLNLQRQQHLLSVSDAYFNVLRQQALTMTHVQEEKALSEQLQMMNAKLSEGLVAKSDVSEANAQFQNARANRIAGGVQLILAQEQLTQLIGVYQENLAVLRDDFQYEQPIPASLDEWRILAQSHNLDIQKARLAQQYANDQRRIDQAANYPQIEAVASYGINKQSPETLISGNGQVNQIGVEMNLNLFNGGRTQKTIQQSTIKVKKADADLDAAIRKASIDVKKQYLQIDTDQSILKARLAAMQSAEIVSRASRAQYDEGLKNMVDVLLAQRNAFSAKQDYVNAQYDYVMNVLRLKASVGQLNDQAIQDLNQWLVMK